MKLHEQITIIIIIIITVTEYYRTWLKFMVADKGRIMHCKLMISQYKQTSITWLFSKFLERYNMITLGFLMHIILGYAIV